MNLESLFEYLKKPALLKKSPVVCVTGSIYPILFFSFFKRTISKLLDGQSCSINLDSIEIEQLKAELSVSFLASSLFYWCGNINTLDAKSKKKFLAFIKKTRRNLYICNNLKML